MVPAPNRSQTAIAMRGWYLLIMHEWTSERTGRTATKWSTALVKWLACLRSFIGHHFGVMLWRHRGVSCCQCAPPSEENSMQIIYVRYTRRTGKMISYTHRVDWSSSLHFVCAGSAKTPAFFSSEARIVWCSVDSVDGAHHEHSTHREDHKNDEWHGRWCALYTTQTHHLFRLVNALQPTETQKWNKNQIHLHTVSIQCCTDYH